MKGDFDDKILKIVISGFFLTEKGELLVARDLLIFQGINKDSIPSLVSQNKKARTGRVIAIYIDNIALKKWSTNPIRCSAGWTSFFSNNCIICATVDPCATQENPFKSSPKGLVISGPKWSVSGKFPFFKVVKKLLRCKSYIFSELAPKGVCFDIALMPFLLPIHSVKGDSKNLLNII